MDPLFSELGKTLISMGPGGIIAAWAVYLWRDVRSENTELREKVMKLLEDTIVSRTEMARSLDRLTDRIGSKP